MTRPAYKFFLMGLLVAALEEFITQGVLKNDLVGWIIPTIIAFLPFLVVARLLGSILDKKLEEWQATLAYYAAAGGIGLLIEWFVIGLTPWSNPNLLQIPFQLGMFSFWGTVAFAPRLLLDRRDAVARIRKSYRRALLLAVVVTYYLTFAASHETQFLTSIVSVIVSFILLNYFCFAYIRILKAGSRCD